MRKLYYFLLIAVLLICGSAKNTAVNKDAERPNIVLILSDDTGFSDIGSYGGEIGTPNIDWLAKEGIRFTQMYNNAWCSPSRASLLTGLYPQQAGMGVLAKPKLGPAGPYQGYLNENCKAGRGAEKRRLYHGTFGEMAPGRQPVLLAHQKRLCALFRIDQRCFELF